VARLRFTESAERDLVEVGNFIARDNPANAARFVERLEEHCELLASRPLIGRARNELVPGLRSLPFGRYVIFIAR
jgi:toxin ParE1/3/4